MGVTGTPFLSSGSVRQSHLLLCSLGAEALVCLLGAVRAVDIAQISRPGPSGKHTGGVDSAFQTLSHWDSGLTAQGSQACLMPVGYRVKFKALIF